MDRFIHTALNSINMVKDNSFIRSNNLANNSVPGYRSDYHLKTAGTAFLETMDSHVTRGLAIKNNTNNFDASSGTLNETGNEMDVSIASFSELSNLLNYELLTRIPSEIPRHITE